MLPIRTKCSIILQSTIKVSSRNYCSDNKLKVIFHQFSMDEAIRKFNEHDSKRFFALSNVSNNPENSIKKVLLPFFYVNESIISKTDYKGSYGIDTTWVTVNSKGESKIHTHTDWYDITGSLQAQRYADQKGSLRVYSGFTFDDKIVDESIGSQDVSFGLIPFNPQEVSSDTVIDPFLMREEASTNIFQNIIYNYEKDRAKKDIEERVDCDAISIDKLLIDYSSFKISGYLLPAYIQKLEKQPPRILPAIDINPAKVYGANPISVPKSMITGLLVSALAAVAFPQFALASRLIGVVTTPVLTGFWAKYRLGIANAWQERKMKKRLTENSSLPETNSDKKRITATEINPKEIKVLEGVKSNASNKKYLKILGLNEEELLNEEKINSAFENVQKNFRGNSRELVSKTQDILEARRVLLSYVKITSKDIKE